MNKLELTHNTDNLVKAMARVPGLLGKYMRPAVWRSSQEMARSAKHHAPKAFSTLTQAINAIMISPLEAHVIAGTNYPRAVEEGTEGGKMPPMDNLIDWIRVKRITPNDPLMDQEDLAYLIGRKIARDGTPAQPFMQPAFDENKQRAINRMNAAIDKALRAA